MSKAFKIFSVAVLTFFASCQKAGIGSSTLLGNANLFSGVLNKVTLNAVVGSPIQWQISLSANATNTQTIASYLVVDVLNGVNITVVANSVGSFTTTPTIASVSAAESVTVSAQDANGVVLGVQQISSASYTVTASSGSGSGSASCVLTETNQSVALSAAGTATNQYTATCSTAIASFTAANASVKFASAQISGTTATIVGTFSSANTYSISLGVTLVSGQTASNTVTTTVSAAPTVLACSLTATPTATLTLNFDGTVNGLSSPVTYILNANLPFHFNWPGSAASGPGSFNLAANPPAAVVGLTGEFLASHSAAGTYNVTMAIISNDGTQSATCISNNTVVTAAFPGNPTVVCNILPSAPIGIFVDQGSIPMAASTEGTFVSTTNVPAIPANPFVVGNPFNVFSLNYGQQNDSKTFTFGGVFSAPGNWLVSIAMAWYANTQVTGSCSTNVSVLPVPGFQPPTPVYDFEHIGPTHTDHLLTQTPSELAGLSGWVQQETNFYVYPVATKSCGIPYYRCYRNGSHFVSTDQACEGHGASDEGGYGFGCGTQVPGTLPLYRVANYKTGDYLSTVDINLINKVLVPAGYVVDGPQGFSAYPN